jgi:hypothetical protein
VTRRVTAVSDRLTVMYMAKEGGWVPSCWISPRRDCDACDDVLQAFLRAWGRALGRGLTPRHGELALTSPRTLLFETKPFWSHVSSVPETGRCNHRNRMGNWLGIEARSGVAADVARSLMIIAQRNDDVGAWWTAWLSVGILSSNSTSPQADLLPKVGLRIRATSVKEHLSVIHWLGRQSIVAPPCHPVTVSHSLN